jgi:diguanylate cyclase (GGDEF)-like protein
MGLAEKPGRGAGLVMLHGDEPGRLYALTGADSIIGSGPRSDIRLAGEGVDKRHARIGYGGRAVLLRDLESAHGTFVNGERIAEYELRHGDVVRVGRTLFALIAGANLAELHREEIYRLATIDGLTQAYNRRYFLEQLDRELGRCRRYGRRLTLGLFELDGLGALNRSHGRLAGDQLLAETAALVQSRIRREDLFGRLAGGEFALALPEISLPQGLAVGDKLRRLIEEREHRLGGKAISLTISMGLVEYRGKAVEAAALLRQVDVKLAEAKRRGHNQVCV